tara:strand:- start:71 stop:322 length:252 start_codon:yes stop_codon:yes gene_type:complete
MKSDDIAVIHALSRLREYCVKEKKSVDGLIKDLLSQSDNPDYGPKNMKQSDRTDYNEYEGSSTAYFDVIRIIESQIVGTVTEE